MAITLTCPSVCLTLTVTPTPCSAFCSVTRKILSNYKSKQINNSQKYPLAVHSLCDKVLTTRKNKMAQCDLTVG